MSGFFNFLKIPKITNFLSDLTGINKPSKSYIKYNPTTNPIPVGTFVNPYLSFEKKWQQADTADRCHKNAFLMYNEIRKNEDKFLYSATTKEDGLAVRIINGKYPGVDIFRDQSFNVNKITAQPVDGMNSIEWTGFFVPDKNANYTFSLTNGAQGRIWVGDVACYEFLESNQTKTQIPLKKNKYYAVRFQYINNLNSGNVDIMVKKDGKIMDGKTTISRGKQLTNPLPKFKTVKKDGTQFFRKLMYYGLVGSGIPGGVFYFYHNNGKNYREIQDAKHKNVVVYDRIISSDVISSDTYLKTYIVSESKPLDIKMNSDLYTLEIITATYGHSNKQTNIKQILTDIANKNNGNISIKPRGYNAIFGDPFPRKPKTASVTVKITLNEKAKKNRRIYLNDNCQVVVDYNDPNSKNPDFILPVYSAGGKCRGNSTIKISNDGKVQVNEKTWISPISNETKSVPNMAWKISNLATLPKNVPLSSITSPNNKYKLEFSNGRLVYKHSRDPLAVSSDKSKSKFTNTYNNITSSEYDKSPVAYYLYRPRYSQLGGKMYMKKTTRRGTKLTEIPPTVNRVVQNGYHAVKGYPIPDGPYTKFNSTSDVVCRTKCNTSANCGNYVYNKTTNDCWIDASANVRPMYNTYSINNTKESKNNMPSIYKKKYKMNGNEVLSYEKSGEYSDYKITRDAMKSKPLPSSILSASGEFGRMVNENSRKAANVIRTGNAINERFVGGSTVEGFRDIPERYLTQLPPRPDTSTEEGRINDLQTFMYQQNVLYSLSSIAALSFLVGAIVLARN